MSLITNDAIMQHFGYPGAVNDKVRAFFNALYTGSGSPEGVTTADTGAFYLDTTNGALYAKQSGSGNTGWIAGVAPGSGSGPYVTLPAGATATTTAPFLTPDMYGATGSGADETTGLLAVMNAAVATGARLVFQPGKTYQMTSFSWSAGALVLDLNGSTLQRALGSNANFLNPSGTASLKFVGGGVVDGNSCQAAVTGIDTAVKLAAGTYTSGSPGTVPCSPIAKTMAATDTVTIGGQAVTLVNPVAVGDTSIIISGTVTDIYGGSVIVDSHFNTSGKGINWTSSGDYCCDRSDVTFTCWPDYALIAVGQGTPTIEAVFSQTKAKITNCYKGISVVNIPWADISWNRLSQIMGSGILYQPSQTGPDVINPTIVGNKLSQVALNGGIDVALNVLSGAFGGTPLRQGVAYQTLRPLVALNIVDGCGFVGIHIGGEDPTLLGNVVNNDGQVTTTSTAGIWMEDGQDSILVANRSRGSAGYGIRASKGQMAAIGFNSVALAQLAGIALVKDHSTTTPYPGALTGLGGSHLVAIGNIGDRNSQASTGTYPFIQAYDGGATFVAMLNSNVASGTITSLPVYPVVNAITSGDTITCGSETFTANGATAVGATTIAVNSHATSTTMAKGTFVKDTTLRSGPDAVTVIGNSAEDVAVSLVGVLTTALTSGATGVASLALTVLRPIANGDTLYLSGNANPVLTAAASAAIGASSVATSSFNVLTSSDGSDPYPVGTAIYAKTTVRQKNLIDIGSGTSALTVIGNEVHNNQAGNLYSGTYSGTTFSQLTGNSPSGSGQVGDQTVRRSFRGTTASPIVIAAGDSTGLVQDDWVLATFASGGAYKLPSGPANYIGKTYRIENVHGGGSSIIIKAAGAETLYWAGGSGTTYTDSRTSQYAKVDVISDGTGWRIVAL